MTKTIFVSPKAKKVLASVAIVSVVAGLALYSMPVSADPFAVFTHPSADITQNSAVVSGELSNLGGRDSANVWFEYGPTESYGSRTNTQTMRNLGTFQATLSGLNACTSYHYKAVADNGSSVVNGVDRTFYTLCTNDQLRVILEAIPYSGPAPLNNVDLKADVIGKTAGDVQYWFDCNNDGRWDRELNMYQGPSSSYVSDNLCNYATPGTYTAKVRVSRLGLSAEDTTTITVTGNQPTPTPTPSGQYTLSVNKTVQNLTNNTGFLETAPSNFGDELVYKIIITSSGQVAAPSVYVKDILPSGITYLGSLTIDNVADTRSITDGILLGDLPAGSSKTITFKGKVQSQEFFNFGTNNLINSALVYNVGLSISDTATVSVVKRTVAGAATEVNTGIADTLLGSLLLPLGLAGLIVFLFKSQILGLDKVATVRKTEVDNYRAEKKLRQLIKKRK